jgi:uncharacterized protein
MSDAEAEDFLAQDALAVAGVSRHGRGFGYKVWKHLRSKGIRVYPINPGADTLEGESVYASVRALPEPVGGVVTVVPPERTLEVVRDCIEMGIPRVWMQPGSESDAAIALAQENGLDVIWGACLLMT